MPKLRALTESPPDGQGTPEEQIRALRDYIARMQEELYYLLTHLETENTGAALWNDIDDAMPKPYAGSPQMDGVASPGGSTSWARGDHRHPKDSSKADKTALDGHLADKTNPHEVTKTQVGLGNVANVLQYSAENPPPLPEPGDIGAVPVTRTVNGKPLSSNISLDAADVSAVPSSAKGSAGGVAELDGSGKVPSAQLPSYVDDVLEYPTLAGFPATGESGKIYTALDTNLVYRWGGSEYVEISQSLALGETASTAYAGNKGKANADGLAAHAADKNNPHDVTKTQVGLGNVANERQYSAENPPPVPEAEDISYDGTQSGMQAANLQDAIDELAASGGGPSPSDALPQMDGTAAAGSSKAYARGDHVHPHDETAQPIWVNIPATSALPVTVSSAWITADHQLTELSLSDPSAMDGTWTWATSAGALTISGTISGSTTMRAKLELKLREITVN